MLLDRIFLGALGLLLGSFASMELESALERPPRFPLAAPVGVEPARRLETPKLLALLGLPAPSATPPEESELPQPTIAGTLAPAFAAIIDDQGRMRTLAVGETLGEAEVVLVEHFAVLWRYRGHLVRSDVAHPPTRPRTKTPGATTLPKSALQAALLSFPELARTVQVVPEFSDASSHVFRGFRLQRLGPSSILSTAGLAVGDVVERINGLDLSRPEHLGRLLAQAPTVEHIEVDLSRGGQPLHLSVEVSP